MLSLFSCCVGEKYRLNLPSAQVESGKIKLITIYIDSEFTSDEELIINNAFKAWHIVSDNIIQFNIINHERKPGNLERYFWTKQYNNAIFVWKANSENISEAFDDKYASYAG